MQLMNILLVPDVISVLKFACFSSRWHYSSFDKQDRATAYLTNSMFTNTIPCKCMEFYIFMCFYLQNIVGNEEIAWHECLSQAISSYSTMFSKAFFFKGIKRCQCLVIYAVFNYQGHIAAAGAPNRGFLVFLAPVQPQYPNRASSCSLT